MSIYAGIVLFNYRLTRQLGEGGFGVVYEAVHEQLGRRAAVKILHPAYARHDEVVARFFREAQAACAIGHRAIVDTTNFGRLDTGEPFIMMDFVAGRSLSAVIAEDGPLPFERIPAVFGPIASALTAAHTKGVIHRDLKPDNIMVAIEDGEVVDVKLLDFGIAKLTDARAGDLSTRAGSVMGTPSYMAPEQATDAKRVDARADVYSFAATVFTGVTGRMPFESDSTMGLLLLVTTQPAPRLRTLRTDAPEALERAIGQCMEKDPALRPPTIDAAWRAICAAVSAPPVRSVAPVPAAPVSVAGTTAAPAQQTTLSAAAGEQPRGPRRRRIGLALAGVGGVGVVVAAAIVIAMAAGGGARVATPETTDADEIAASSLEAPPADAIATHKIALDDAGHAFAVIDSSGILAREPRATKADVKHVLLAWKELAPIYQGRIDKRAEHRSNAEAARLALGLAAMLKASPGRIDALVTEHSEDPGSLSGARYTVETDSPFVAEFKNLALRLDENEVGIVKTPFGYHVMVRVPPLPLDPLESADILARIPVTQQAKVKHILLGSTAVNTGDARGVKRTRAELESLVEKTVAALQKGDRIEPLMKRLSEDPGSAASGASYDVTPDAGLIAPFKDLSLRLHKGEAGVVATRFGIHIIKRVE